MPVTLRGYWIPAEDLDAFHQHIVGPIEVIATYPCASETKEPQSVIASRRPDVTTATGASRALLRWGLVETGGVFLQTTCAHDVMSM
jgi:hypothetical protein